MATPTPLDDLLAQLRRGGTPNPFFLISNQFLPRNFNDVIRWSRFVLTQSPTLSEVIRKYSTYPITSFVVESPIENHKKAWKKIIKKVKLKTVLEEAGFNYYSMGNHYASVYFPLTRMMACSTQGCGAEYNYATSSHFIKFKNYKFEGVCPKCKSKVNFERRDIKSLSLESLSIISWPVEHVSVHKNPITGVVDYYYTIPNYVKKGILSGDPLYISSTPWTIIEAVKEGKDYMFDKNNFFHLKNMTFGDLLNGYGLPPLVSTYSHVFYQVLLRKANEAVATERLTSMRIISPRPASGNTDPAVGINLRGFARQMEDNIKKFKKDPNHIMISPVPTEINNLGGDGRALLVTQELQAAEETVLLGMGIPRELMAGTVNWTSSTVGLRLLENSINNYVEQVLEFLEWIVDKINSYYDFTGTSVTLLPFKLMDDDTARQQAAVMAEKGLIAPSTWLESFGFDLEEEQQKNIKDQIKVELSKIELEHQLRLARFTKAKDVNSAQDDSSDMQRSDEEAKAYAQQIVGMAPDQQKQALFQIKSQDPALYQLVASYMESYQTMPTTEGNPETDGVQPSSSAGPTSGGSSSRNSTTGSGSNDVKKADTASSKT